MHRRVSLLALAFLGAHVVTTVIDTFVSIPLIDAFIPFIGSYRPFWLGLGAVALDLALAVVITSLARDRIGFRAWRAVHWLSYACWPIAVIHGLGTGSDANTTWLLVLTGLCILAVSAAAVWRIARGWPDDRRGRLAGAAALVVFLVFLLAWLPGGPLGANWAKRSGTPARPAAATAPARPAQTTPSTAGAGETGTGSASEGSSGASPGESSGESAQQASPGQEAPQSESQAPQQQ